MKRYYSVPDTAIVRDTPQPIQHLANNAMATKLGGGVVFYTMEDHYTLQSHEVILGKLAERPAIDGVIFYQLAQFARNGDLNVRVLRQILEQNYAVAFAREQIALADLAALDDFFPLLATNARLLQRDHDHAFTRATFDLVTDFVKR